MAFASFRYQQGRDRARLRPRAVALALAVIVHGLMIALLFMQSRFAPRQVEERHPVSFVLMPKPKAEPAPTRTAQKRKQTETAAASPPAKPAEKPPTPPLPFVLLTRDELASADIGNLPKGAAKAEGVGQGSAASYGPGEGPGGVRLYEAEWYRRPTGAELSTYIPAGAPRTGWGLVACKTVENYRVDNCQSIGESPPGSGFGRAVRLAAWQFMVRPPRVDGKALVGSWVRIRIDYLEGAVQ